MGIGVHIPLSKGSNNGGLNSLGTTHQVAGNLSFKDLDLDLGDLGGEITWSVPQDWEDLDFFVKKCGG